jgi:hypothetical protein
MKPLNYERYKDLESEFTTESLIEFIIKIGGKYKEELQSKVSSHLFLLSLSVNSSVIYSLRRKNLTVSLMISLTPLQTKAKN